MLTMYSDSGHSVYYDLESHILNTIRPRFYSLGYLDVKEFFLIIIWKANRSKSKIANHLIRNSGGTCDRAELLADAVSSLTRELAGKSSPEERFSYLVGAWGFRLPMASAILSMLYPDDFTVYDVRVCSELDAFGSIANRVNPGNLWAGYQDYIAAVQQRYPGMSLRDADRALWGASFHRQLIEDVEKGIPVRE